MSRRKKCTHHWVIDSPNGRESSGICKHCDATKLFPNSSEAVVWKDVGSDRSPHMTERDQRLIAELVQQAED